jgi:hypothetical protein
MLEGADVARRHMMSKLASVFGRTCARLLGAVLLLASYAKAVDPQDFVASLREMVPVPATLAFAFGLAVIGYEAGLGTALLGGSRRRGVLVLATATFLIFVGAVAWQLVRPGEAASCGCFGRLLERTPAQALYEDVAFVILSGCAWLGGAAPTAALRPWPVVLVAGTAVALALCAPWLPLDDHVTALAPGVTVAATHLDEVVPELRTGRHLVLLLDRADPATSARIVDLNERLKLPGGPTSVWGVADDDSRLAVAFLWSAGPAFQVRSAPPRMLRRLYRTLPRSALIDGGHVVATWSGFPSDATLDSLSRGELP